MLAGSLTDWQGNDAFSEGRKKAVIAGATRNPCKVTS